MRAQAPAPAPDFDEVYGLIRSHLSGVDSAELNRKAVDALLKALSPKVSLVEGQDKQVPENPGSALVTKTSLFEGPIGYIRIGRVDTGLAAAVREGYQQLATNRLNGIVLDLRFAEGPSFEAAAETVDLFVKKEMALLDWGKGTLRSKEKSDAISLPVAVLMNRRTSRAAEALAAALREVGAGLLVGSLSAGQAMIAQDFQLKTGQTIRIATAPVKVGDAALPPEGVKPDLAINPSLEDELAYLADPFKQLHTTNSAANSSMALNGTGNGTNRTRRVRFSEAELVRERREGLPPDVELSARGDAETEKPVVRDPALARALDVLKGLAVVRQSRS